ncbi:MAG: hypothetical protein P1U58_14275 [Verrucomicrobiales bacterium]|nr:hypothetical protein [Verrucomicrobiales bacterium]
MKPEISDLIEWGRLRLEGRDLPGDVRERLAGRSALNRRHWSAWQAECASLDRTALELLIRGLTLAERELEWTGGSVSGVIWTYRIFEQRHPEAAEELADWILRNSKNDYVPFGDNHGGVQSLDEYQLYQLRKFAKQRNHEERDKALQEARKERIRQRAAAARRRERHARKRSAERKQFLEALESKSLLERLEHIAKDEQRPVEFYPEFYALQAAVRLEKLPDELLKALQKKLDRRNRGKWGALNRRIREYSGD